MLSHIKILFATLILLAAATAVSAESREVIQDERGTFIQDQSGPRHQYKRMRREVAPLPVLAGVPAAPTAFGYNTAVGGMASGGGNLIPLW